MTVELTKLEESLEPQNKVVLQLTLNPPHRFGFYTNYRHYAVEFQFVFAHAALFTFHQNRQACHDNVE